MKHTIYGISLMMITVMVIVIVMGISGKNVRKNEMETTLNTAVEQSLEQLKIKGGYGIETYQELVADFNQGLLLQMESDADIRVEVLTADAQKGVLNVKITERYHNILGKTEEIACQKAVILEEYSNKRMYHQVDFFVEGEVYAAYSIYEGSMIALPKEPQKEGHTFKGWKDTESGALFEAGKRAEGDLSFEAVFE